MTEEYKRSKPIFRTAYYNHSCYDGHDCTEVLDLEGHLACVLGYIDKIKELIDQSNYPDYLPDNKKEFEMVKHHIRKAWDKSK